MAIIGNFSAGGIDTGDATATENDILNGKTAYVNGQKLYGGLYIDRYTVQITGAYHTTSSAYVTMSGTRADGSSFYGRPNPNEVYTFLAFKPLEFAFGGQFNTVSFTANNFYTVTSDTYRRVLFPLGFDAKTININFR